MASEILGLFGGQTPQQLRNAFLDSTMVSPQQMGSQGLLQQVVSMGRNAGSVMGAGAGRLLGGKVAGEVEASYLEDAIKAGQAGKTPTEKMKLVAAALEDKPGMGAQYMKALTESRRLEAEDFTMAQAKEKSNIREVKRQVDIVDAYSGKITGQRTATVTQQWTGEYDEKGNKIWADIPGQDSSTPTGEPTSALDAEAARRKAQREEEARNNTQVGATTTPVAGQALPTPRVLPPQNLQLTEAERLEQEYYDQQRAANPQAAPAPTRPALPRLTFKTVEAQENAMRMAVAAGNRELAMRIRDAQVGTNR